MESLTVRVSRSTHELLHALAMQSKSTLTAIIDEAARELQRKRFWEGFHASCETVNADPTTRSDLQSEDAEWEITLGDGIEGGPHGTLTR